MTTPEIKAALWQLHDELAQSGTADPEIQDLLRVVESDIHAVLDFPNPEPATQPSKLTKRINDMALEMECGHPTIATALHQVSEALSRMGL